MKAAEKAAGLVRRYRSAFVAGLVALSLSLWGAVGVSAWWLKGVVTGLPDAGDVREIAAMAQATTLYDASDRPAFTIYKEQRIPVPIDKVSPHLVRALLAVEDQRFFEHGGLDVVRIAGAFVSNVRTGRTAQGGSTLTQQLARQSFLTAEKTYRRKVKEMIVAARIEREFEKRDILQLYMNKVYFGDGLYGVEAASLGYFGKPAADLALSEAALLAGLVKSPSSYAPTVDLDRAVARRKIVLQAMRDTGAIDAATFETASNAPVHLSDALRRDEPFGQYFKEEVRRQLVDRFGWERVYQGGLRVYTTIDLNLQKSAEAEVARGLEEIERRQQRRGNADTPQEPLQAALVAMDPHSGEVRVIVGGRDFEASHFNRVTQAERQAGSAFKPFVFAAAIEQGFSPGTLLTDLNNPIWTPQGDWVPEDGHSTASSMTIRAALKTSSNRAAVRMLQDVGIPTAVTYAERLGMTSVPRVPSLVLGAGDVTLMSMASAYSAFANGGLVPSPILIRRVESADGEVLYTGAPASHRAISETTAFLMSNMLADVIDSGTAWSARRVGFTLPAAGKTGTTNDYRDAWFVGYTPQVVAGVWVGYDMPRTIVSNGYAAELAVPIWARFMRTATKGHKSEWFRAPTTVTSATICRLSGHLATDDCRNAVTLDEHGDVEVGSSVYTEYFVKGTVPTTYCPLHQTYEDRSWRLFSTSRTPDNTAPRETAVRRPQEERAAAADAGQPPGVTGGVVPQSAEAEPSPEQPRRRGFWGRLFGIGRRDAPPDAQDAPERPPQPSTPRTR